MIPVQVPEFAAVAVQQLQASLESKMLNASRKLSNSITFQVDEATFGVRVTILTTEGQAYWQIVNAAQRKPGGSWKQLYPIILSWSYLKPITFDSDNDRKRFAAVVSQNIVNGDYMKWNRDSRKNFATDAVNSPEWMAAETQAIEAIAEQVFSPIDTFFKAPTPAN